MICGPGQNSGLRFARKTANEMERKLFQSWWNELYQLYGTYIDYFTYEYSLTGHDYFYGEQPLAPFTGPTPMIMLAQFNNDSLLLSKFGIRTDADVTFIIPILAFRTAFNSNTIEPKAGDLIRLTELGWDRPGGIEDINTLTVAATSCESIQKNDPLYDACDTTNIMSAVNCKTDAIYYSAYEHAITYDQITRGAPIYEITERRDENLTMNYNMLQGHYVWILYAKRFDYSYQPNAPREPGHDQVSDETLYGKLTGGTDYAEKDKLYDQNTENESNRKIWDYDKRPGSDDSVYGNY